jgi:hypothetical protein
MGLHRPIRGFKQSGRDLRQPQVEKPDDPSLASIEEAMNSYSPCGPPISKSRCAVPSWYRRSRFPIWHAVGAAVGCRDTTSYRPEAGILRYVSEGRNGYPCIKDVG